MNIEFNRHSDNNVNFTRKIAGGAMALLAAALTNTVATSAIAGETLAVAQGETKNISEAKTVSAMDVHGTLNVQGTLAVPAEIKVDPKSTAVSLGTDAGDNAVINIGDYGRIEGGQYNIGGANGIGGFVIGGSRKDNATSYGYLKAHLASGQITLSADATSDTGVIDILTLNEGAYAGIKEKSWSGSYQAIVNRSTQADARVLFNGGVLVFFSSYGSYVFFSSHSSSATYSNIIPEGEGGKAIVLEGVNGNPVEIHVAGGQSGTWPIQGKTYFRGSGDVILHGANNDLPSKWLFSSSADTWAQNGDLKLTGAMSMVIRANNCLPRASTNGIVQVLGNSLCHFDLYGKTNAVNGFVVAGGATLTNSVGGVAQLVLGSVVPNGVFSVAKVGGGPIEMVKRGTGTLTVTNTPSFPSMRVEAGTALFKDDDCTLGLFSASAGTSVVVDNSTLAFEAADASGATFQVNRGATLDGSHISGGLPLSKLTVDCSSGTGDGTLSNVSFAASGEIRLVNVEGSPAPSKIQLPLVVVDSTGIENLGNWIVHVNGERVGKKLSCRGNRLVYLLNDGTVISFR